MTNTRKDDRRPMESKLVVRISDEDRKILEELAAEDGRTLSNYVRYSLQEIIKERKHE